MLNKKNIELTENNQYEFILGEKLKSLAKTTQEYLLNIENYTRTWVYNKDDQPIVIRYCQLDFNGKTIIGTFSEKRAAKDRKEREEKLEKAKVLLKHPELLKRKAHHYFLKADKNEKYVSDAEKIKRNERYDGFLAITTNVKTMTPEQMLDNYKHLYQIEHSFRTFKTYLETRPMFHWTDKRIEGHICLCYIAYTLLTYLQNKLEKSGFKLSEIAIRKAISSMQVSYIKNQKTNFYLRSANKENVDGLINKLGIKKLPNIIPQAEISSYL